MAQPQQPSQASAPADSSLIATLAAILASGLAASVIASQVIAVLGLAGIAPVVAAEALRAVLARPGPRYPLPRPLSPTARPGAAQRATEAEEPAYRAAYLLAAARRLQAAPDIAAAKSVEQSYLDAHVAASENRLQAARRVDALSAVHGPLLGWRATLDARTTQECRFLSGRNFRADSPPFGVYPGAMHRFCRCVATRPYAGAPVVGGTSTLFPLHR